MISAVAVSALVMAIQGGARGGFAHALPSSSSSSPAYTTTGPLSRVAGWEFSDGVEGWGGASASGAAGGGMGLSAGVRFDPSSGTIDVRTGGGAGPGGVGGGPGYGAGGGVHPAWIDSPSMRVGSGGMDRTAASPGSGAGIDDSAHVVLRMRHVGSADAGMLWLRRDDGPAGTAGGAGGGAWADGGSAPPLDNETLPSRDSLPPLLWAPEASGPSSPPSYWARPFDVVANGRWRVYAVPVADVRLALPASPTPTLSWAFSQIRLFPALRRRSAASAAQLAAAQPPSATPTGAEAALLDYLPSHESAVSIDYIRIVSAPTILSVEGCGEGIGAAGGVGVGAGVGVGVGGGLEILRGRTGRFTQRFASMADALRRRGASTAGVYATPADEFAAAPFARTFACDERGGERITIRGRHFGARTLASRAAAAGGVAPAEGTYFAAVPAVYIDGAPCTDVRWLAAREGEDGGEEDATGGEGTALECTTPPRPVPRARAPGPASSAATEDDPSADARDTAVVTVAHAQQRVLTDSKPFFRWTSPPSLARTNASGALLSTPVVTNVAARSVEVQWRAAESFWTASATTGYVVQWRVAILDDNTAGNTSPGCGEGKDGATPAAVAVAGEVAGVDAGGVYVDMPVGSGGSPALFPGKSRRRVYVAEATEVGAGAIGAKQGVGPGLGPAATATARIASGVAWGPWGASPGGGELVTGNRTSVTVRGLEEGRRYQFRVAAISEGMRDGTLEGEDGSAKKAGVGAAGDGPAVVAAGQHPALRTDEYNVRLPPTSAASSPSAPSLPPLMAQGDFTLPSCDARTLAFDVLFTSFGANATLDHGPAHPASSVGNDGWAGGEGHYGLVVVGSAHTSNCNATHVCCDGFGGRYFLDIVRFLDGWSGSEWPKNASQHGSCSEGEAGNQPGVAASGSWTPAAAAALASGAGAGGGPAPLYRYNASAGDFNAVHLDWSRAREAADAMDAASAAGRGGLVSADGFAISAAALESANASVGGVFASAAQPALRRGRLAGRADALLGRALGSAPSRRGGGGVGGDGGAGVGGGTWFSLGGAGRASGQVEAGVWDGYDDTGSLAFVSPSQIEALDAQREAEEIAQALSQPGGVLPNGSSVVDGARVPAGVGWAGSKPAADARVAANESGWGQLAFPGQNIGILPGEYKGAGGGASRRRMLGSSGGGGGGESGESGEGGEGGEGEGRMGADKPWLRRPGDAEDEHLSGGPTEEDEEFAARAVAGIGPSRLASGLSVADAVAESVAARASSIPDDDSDSDSDDDGYDGKGDDDDGSGRAAEAGEDGSAGRGLPSRARRAQAAAPGASPSSYFTFAASQLNFTRPVLRTCGAGGGAAAQGGGGARRRYVHHDSAGRRLVGLPAPPTSTCTAVCTGLSAPAAPVLNGAPQRGADVYTDGVLGGARGGTHAVYGTLAPSSSSSGGKSQGAAPPGGPHNARGPHPSTHPPAPVTDAAVSGRVGRVLAGNGEGLPPGVSLSEAFSQPYPPFTSSAPQVQILDPRTPTGAAWAAKATGPCGPALRLTGSHPSSAGAAWYGRALHVSEGFDTVFAFRMSGASRHCRIHHDVSGACASRGGAGMAFVVQTSHPGALGGGGGGGSGMGYAGLQPSLAVEFDPWADSELGDPHEPHVSVHARGPALPNSANHSAASLGHAPRPGSGAPLRDIADGGVHIARVLYEPLLTSAHISHPAFAPSSGHSSSFFSFRGVAGTGGGPGVAADFPLPDLGLSSSSSSTSSSRHTAAASSTDWGSEGGAGVGALSVFLDDETQPVLVVPLDLTAALAARSSGGRAFVGFTAATGPDVWQTHDVLAWHFTSLRAEE